jgi:hypothetical protein
MGQFISGWVIYGFAAPENLREQEMEAALNKSQWKDIGYVMAGPYDHDLPYVVAFAESGSPRRPEAFELPTKKLENAWKASLIEVAQHNGWPVPEPKWLVLADVS